MFKTIVVGVDRSDTGRAAAAAARTAASTFGAELHLVHAFADRHPDDPRSADRRQAEAFLASLASSTGDRVVSHALPGDPVDAILLVVKELDADLVVVGNQGMHGLARILGSVPAL